MDDFDIYGDLHVIEAEANQERQEVQELEQKIADLQAQLLAKEQEKQAIVEKNVILSENISSLLLTAKAELKRKDTIIADLRKQCDDTIFRRKHVQYKEVHRASKCTQTYYVRQTHVGVQVEQAEDESVGRTKKSDAGKIYDRDRQKDRDRERSSYRERDRVRERDRTRDRDKSQALDRDHDRFRERDRHKDWHRDREQVHPRPWERDQAGDRHRTRDSSGHRNYNERNDNRSRESSKDSDRKNARERQKEYQYDLETRCEPRGARATAKSTDQHKDKPLRNDQKSIRQEDSLHSTDRKTKMQNRENSVFEVAARSHTLVSQSTSRRCDAIENKNEELPIGGVIPKLPEEMALTDQPLCSGVECSETNEKKKETDRMPLLANKPVAKTVEIHIETYPSVSSISIDDCGFAEKNAVILGQKKSEKYSEASVLDNPVPYSIPAAIESVSDDEKNLQCHRNQQNHVSVTQQTEMSYFGNTDCFTNRVDCGKLIDSPQGLDKTDQSSHLSNLNQNKKSCPRQSVEDATIFANMLDVCGESRTIEDQGHPEANIDVKALNSQIASSSFLENVLQGVDDVRNKSNGNINFVSKNNEVVDDGDATHQAEGIPKERKDSCKTTEGIVHRLPSDDTHITNQDTSIHGKADGNLESFGHGAVGDTAGKTSAKITVDVHYSQDKSYNVEDISVWKDHSMSLDEGAKEQDRLNVALDRVGNAIDYAGTNNGLNLVVHGGESLKKQLKPYAHDVHSKSKIISNEHQTPSAENAISLSETSGAAGETPASVPKSCPENTHDSLGVSDSEPAHREAQTSAPMRLEENPIECRIEEHVDEIKDSGSHVQHQQGMRTRSKSVCLAMVTVCRQDDDHESCDNDVVYSPSKTEKAQLMSKTGENVSNCKTSDVVGDHGAPSKPDSSSSSVILKQRDKCVPLSKPDGSGSIRDRLRKKFCTDRYHKSSRFSGPSKRLRRSLDSAPIAPKKQKAENDCIDSSKSSSASTAKLSDTFFSSIFLPIASSLDSIHKKAESPRPIRTCPLHPSNMESVVVCSPIKFECQDATQELIDSFLVPWVKDADDGEGHGCIANDHSRKDNEVDNIRFSPQHLLASSTPLIVKPQSRLHHSTSSVPAMPSDGGACAAVKVTLNSKSWTAPLEQHPSVPCGSSPCVTADTANDERKSTEVVVDVSKSKRPTRTSKAVHRQSDDERRICMSNDTDDRIVVNTGKDRLIFSPGSIDKGSKKRHDSAISNPDGKVVVSENAENHASKKNLPPGMFKTPDAVKSRNRLQHTPTNTLSFVSQKQNHSPVATKVRDNGTPLTSRKRSRTSTSPKRRKIDVTEGEGSSQVELSPATNNKRKRRNIAVEEISKESMPTNISIRPREVENKATAEGDVLVRKNKAMSGVRNLSTKGEATEHTIVDKTITSASPLEGSCTASRSSNVSPSTFVAVETLCNRSTPHQMVVVPTESESLSVQGRDTTTSSMSPTSGSATKKMCNFSLNLSLASTSTVETVDTSITQKSETPVRFVREMRIVKENPKLLRVYINRRGD